MIVATAPLRNLQASVGDIFMRTGDRGANRIDALDPAVHQGQDKIEIVDHQIKDHRDIRSAQLERRDPRSLDI